MNSLGTKTKELNDFSSLAHIVKIEFRLLQFHQKSNLICPGKCVDRALSITLITTIM